MNRITVEIGDWSNDGHNRSDCFVVESTLTQSELMTAYRTGVSIIGVDLINDVAKDYEDSLLSKEHEELLRKAGYGFDKDPKGNLYFERYDDEDESTSYSLGVQEYLDIFLFMCRLGEPHQVIQLIKTSHSLHIGGYGLFYS